MKPINFSCPYCDQQVEAQAEMAGMTAFCPSCNSQITIPPFLRAIPKPPRTIITASTHLPTETACNDLQNTKVPFEATASIIFGLLGLAYPSSVLIVSSIAGAVFGHLAFHKTQQSPDTFTGSRIAIFGLGISYVGLAIGLIVGIIHTYYQTSIKLLLTGKSDAEAMHTVFVIAAMVIILVVSLPLVLLRLPNKKSRTPANAKQSTGFSQPATTIKNEQVLRLISHEAATALEPLTSTTGKMVAVLFVTTLGLYAPYWFLSRQPIFNKLKTPLRLTSTVFVACLILFVIFLFSIITCFDTVRFLKIDDQVRMLTDIANSENARIERTNLVGGEPLGTRWTADTVVGVDVLGTMLSHDSLLSLDGGAELIEVAANRSQNICTTAKNLIQLPFFGDWNERALCKKIKRSSRLNIRMEDRVKLYLFLHNKNATYKVYLPLGLVAVVAFFSTLLTALSHGSEIVCQMIIDHIRNVDGHPIIFSLNGIFVGKLVFLQNAINNLVAAQKNLSAL